MKNKISFNILFLIFLYIAIATVVIDYMTFFFNISYLIELIIGLLITGILFVIFKNKINIKNNFEKSDIFFFCFFLVICYLTIVFPDRGFDTLNYHLYNQMYPFADKINFDFFPSSFIQSFSYPYPDRMFYIFRYILGYRLGNILNYFIIIILYYQVKGIIKRVFKVEGLLKNIIATFVVLSISVLDVMDGYYIDLISLVLILELFYKAIYGPLLNDDKKNNTIIISYFGLLAGLIFAAKISNMFLVIFLAIIYIIRNLKNIKKIKVTDYIIFIVLFIIPSILYIYNTWKQTGNPVFPFYNSIFHSNYFPKYNWLDSRFGPKRKLEVLFWPLIILNDPKRTVDCGFVEPILSYGYVIAIIYFIFYVIKILKKKEYDKDKFYFSIICILMNLIWAKFMLGYIRYGLIILFANSIITFIFVYDLFKHRKAILFTIMCLLLSYNYTYCYDLYTKEGNSDYWSYNNSFSYDEKAYQYNLNRLFSKEDLKIEFPKNSIWGVFSSYSGYMKLINDEIKTVYLANSAYETTTTKDKILSEVEHIYTVADYLELDSFIAILNENNYIIKDVYGVYKPSYLNYNDFLYIFEIEKNDKDSNNYVRDTSYEKEIEKVAKKYTLIFGISPMMNNIDVAQYKYKLEVLIDDTVVDSFNIKNNDFSVWKKEYDLTSKSKKIRIRVIDKKGQEIDWVRFNILYDKIEY